MSHSARIDELEKKFSENARRYFAPLANEYRKAGDLDRAIEICRAHLPQQPGHMSGHVVYGQALYESRQLEEAKTVFEAALALDPENLIALRHLGDIARDSGDPEGARGWYLRVLDADPRNDEVAGMLAELEAPAPPAPVASPGGQEGEAAGWGDINPEHAAGEASEGAGEHLVAPSRAAEDDAKPEDRPRDVEAEPVEGGEAQRSSAVSSGVADVGLEPMPSDSAAADSVADEAEGEGETDLTPEDEPAPRRQEAPSLDRMLNEAFAPDEGTADSDAAADPLAAASGGLGSAKGELAPAAPRAQEASPRSDSPTLDDSAFAEVDALFDEISPPSERPQRTTGINPVVEQGEPDAEREGQPADGASDEAAAAPAPVTGDALFGDADLAGAGASPAAEVDRVDGLETREFVPPPRTGSTSGRNTGSMAVSGLTSFEQPTEEDSSTRAAFVTETMAELYLQQGFTEEALDIYRQLLEQNPDDANLRERIEHLERGGRTSLSVAAVSSDVIEAAKQRHAARPVRTVRSFFGRLAGHQLNPREEGEAAQSEELDEPVDQNGGRSALPDRGPSPDGSASPDRGASAEEPLPAHAGRPEPVISVISDLFGEVEVDAADEAAASMLATAFSPSFMGGEGGSDRPPAAGAMEPTGHAPPSGSGKAAHAAGRELSLDQVFRDSGARAQRKSGGYSFDQFFSDGTPSGASARPTPAQGTDAETSEEDPEGDLEQFTAWLEGLKRK